MFQVPTNTLSIPPGRMLSNMESGCQSVRVEGAVPPLRMERMRRGGRGEEREKVDCVSMVVGDGELMYDKWC